MSRLDGLKSQRDLIVDSLQACWVIPKYNELKKKLHLIDEEIARESGRIEDFTFILKVTKRIDELETKRAGALIEKQSCNDLGRYRKLVDAIEILDKTIVINKKLIEAAK